MRRLPGSRGALALAATGGLLALLAFGLAANRPARTLDQAIARGDRARAPDITLPSLTAAHSLSLEALRGHVVVVNVWASWCGPCQSEAPVLQRWYKRIAGLGGTIVGIDTFDARSDAISFVHQFHLSYPMLRDSDGHAKSAFGVTGFPESFVLDRSGKVAAVDRGPVDDAFMHNTVMALLAEKA